MSSSAEKISQDKVDILMHILNNNGLNNTISLFNGADTTFLINRKYTDNSSIDTGIMNDYFSMSWVVYPAIFDFITLNRKLKREVADAVVAYVNGGDSKLIDNYDKQYKENETFCDMFHNRELLDTVLLADADYSDKENSYKLLAEKLTKLLNYENAASIQSILIDYNTESGKFIVTVNSYDEVSSNLINSEFTVEKYSLYIAFAYVYYFAYSKSTLMNNSNAELFQNIAAMFRTTDGLGGWKLLHYVIENKWKMPLAIAKNEASTIKIYNLNPMIAEPEDDDDDDLVEIAKIGENEEWLNR